MYVGCLQFYIQLSFSTYFFSSLASFWIYLKNDWPSGSVLTSFGASTTVVSIISDPSAALSGTFLSKTGKVQILLDLISQLLPEFFYEDLVECKRSVSYIVGVPLHTFSSEDKDSLIKECFSQAFSRGGGASSYLGLRSGEALRRGTRSSSFVRRGLLRLHKSHLNWFLKKHQIILIEVLFFFNFSFFSCRVNRFGSTEYRWCSYIARCFSLWCIRIYSLWFKYELWTFLRLQIIISFKTKSSSRFTKWFSSAFDIITAFTKRSSSTVGIIITTITEWSSTTIRVITSTITEWSSTTFRIISSTIAKRSSSTIRVITSPVTKRSSFRIIKTTITKWFTWYIIINITSGTSPRTIISFTIMIFIKSTTITSPIFEVRLVDRQSPVISSFRSSNSTYPNPLLRPLSLR
ncbi:hypothetical protein AGLY_000392, partial [Aphis glycines]